ncbi:MAG: glutamate synthase subunit beta [Deltaproteobacteria bacterium]|nr:glutamate synthase subunit beta [Deltaproteobacteria bacterium]
MSDPMGFLEIARQKTAYRPVNERVKDWDYVGPKTLPLEQNLQQAKRCMDCGVPFCQSDYGCPVHNVIPEWNSLVGSGRWEEALKKLHATNNFPEFTGFLCPAPCENACVLNRDNQPVTIREIELAIIERGFEAGLVKPQAPREERRERVAIVGSGPAGLAAAQELRRRGFQVRVFDKGQKPGGLLRYGIPDFKMAKYVIDRRIEQMQAEGVEFSLGMSVGTDVSINDLQRDFDAVLLAVGAEAARDLPIPGRDLAGVHLAMDYLTVQNRVLSGEITSAAINAAGKRVAVIGGGDTASDCIGTARRQGAAAIYEFSLLPKPGDERGRETPWPLVPLTLKVSHAHEEGCERLFGVMTTGFSGQDGKVSQLHAVQCETKDGQLIKKAGTEFSLDVDLVLLAIGFVGADAKIASVTPGLVQRPNGTLAGDVNGMTSLPGVFVAGDARRGASLIVWAIAEGRRAADSIERYLHR